MGPKTFRLTVVERADFSGLRVFGEAAEYHPVARTRPAWLGRNGCVRIHAQQSMTAELWLPVAGIVLLVSTYCAVGATRTWAIRWGHYDVPNPRSSHARPVPSGGGVAIVIMILLA